MKRSYSKFQKRIEEIGLFAEVERRAKKMNVSIASLYEGPRVPSISAARKSIYTWLMAKKGMGNNEVARLFDRAPSGIAKMVGGVK